MDIDWLSDESHVLLNPRTPEGERRSLESFVVDLPGHLWLSTSGTSGSLKLTALSKRAMLASADAVNRHLRSDASDVWLCVLPTFHVGGLGIYARAFRSGARVVDEGWDGVTLASLVPAQVNDLVRDARTPPRSLRAVVIGGGAVSDELYRSARSLGWPLLPSYGMTECCSQIATATLESLTRSDPATPELVLLDHVEAGVEEDGRLAVRSAALLTGYGTPQGFLDPKVDGWLVTEDVASLEGSVLRVQGRRGDFIKIGGESVDLSRLDRLLADLGADAAVIAIPDERLGHVVGLAVASGDAEAVAAAFNERVFPFERARRIVRVAEIPKTALGKIMRARIRW